MSFDINRLIVLPFGFLLKYSLSLLCPVFVTHFVNNLILLLFTEDGDTAWKMQRAKKFSWGHLWSFHSWSSIKLLPFARRLLFVHNLWWPRALSCNVISRSGTVCLVPRPMPRTRTQCHHYKVQTPKINKLNYTCRRTNSFNTLISSYEKWH